MFTRNSRLALVVALATIVVADSTARSQVLNEHYNTVTGTGGGQFHSGNGFVISNGWDNGINGERAFAGTGGNARFGSVSAQGLTNGGVGGTGAGNIAVSGINFTLIDEPFTTVTGTGGGAFLTGNGSPNTTGSLVDWDDGITGEIAFGGTADGGILVGSMSAQGLTTGGASGGAGQIDVNNVNVGAGRWYAGLQWDMGPLPGANPLLNGGFESGSVGLGVQNWTRTGNVYTEAITPRTGTKVAKMFGTFPGNSSIYQALPAQPGQTWRLDVWSRHNTGDAISATANSVTMTIEFRDASNVLLLGSAPATILSNASPTNTWIDNTPTSLTAPAGTTTARAIFTFVQPASQGGACLLDDATFKIISGPNPVDPSNLGLSAQVKGIANAGGESLGKFQLRLEDAAGNRLFFRSTATSSYQAIGGLLSTATEADATGTPAVGVFDPNSPSFRVVVAFDNEAAPPWGTGGTLNVDNLLFTNSNSQGSSWYAGLYWDQLVANISNPGQYLLRGDIRGGTVGGHYALRLEAFTLTQAGLNENFEAATGVGGDVLLDGPAIDGGATFGFSGDWDEGISGEGAFGGIAGLIDTQFNPIIVAEAITSGGNPGKAGRIRVENMVVGPGGTWYAGLSWGSQGLANPTDLSQVVLTANVRGTIPLSGGFLGDYELRIEDAQGDRLYFPMTANGAWQTVGGPLSTAIEGAALSGAGDGNFDLDSPSYSVAISFINPELTWFFGGILDVDNLFITPVTIGTQIGEISFPGTANGNYQSVGCLLSTGQTNLGNFEEHFETATLTGGGVFGAQTGNWDNGLVNENAFFGRYGNAAGGAGSAQACGTCGIGGTKAGQLSVAGVTPGTGGWFAGAFWQNIRANLSGDLSQVVLSAKIKGTANAGAGETLGTYFLRIEDSTLTALTFTVTANGAFQNVGGPLSTATLEVIPGGDATFNFNQPTYNVTMGFVGTSGNWGTGGTLTIDDLFLTGVTLNDADAFTVTVAFADEISTWGTSGSLSVDNLFLGQVIKGDMNCDGIVDLADVGPFVTALLDPPAYLSGYAQCCLIELADMNLDTVNDGRDVQQFVKKVTGF